MKVFLVPDITGDREWKLNEFFKHEKWQNILTRDQLSSLDMIPMGGEVEFAHITGKVYKILRIL